MYIYILFRRMKKLLNINSIDTCVVSCSHVLFIDVTILVDCCSAACFTFKHKS